MNRALLESGRENWGTPGDFYGWLDRGFAFTVDVAAEPWSAKHRRFWTKEDNALARDWSTEVGFDNPPYGEKVGDFLEVAKEGAMHGGTSVHVVAARPDTRWWRNATEKGLGKLRRSYFHAATRVWWAIWQRMIVGIYFHDERLTFDLDPVERAQRVAAGKPETESAPFPSAVLIFDPPLHVKRIRSSKEHRTPGPYTRPLLTLGRPR